MGHLGDHQYTFRHLMVMIMGILTSVFHMLEYMVQMVPNLPVRLYNDAKVMCIQWKLYFNFELQSVLD